MNFQPALAQQRAGSRDRDVIRVEFPCDHMGIAAALRRAFADAANDRSDHDFEELLSQLN